VTRHAGSLYRSSSKVKVIGHSSRSLTESRCLSKLVGATSSELRVKAVLVVEGTQWHWPVTWWRCVCRRWCSDSWAERRPRCRVASYPRCTTPLCTSRNDSRRRYNTEQNHLSIPLLRPEGCWWQKWAPYLGLAGRGHCTEIRPELETVNKSQQFGAHRLGPF